MKNKILKISLLILILIIVALLITLIINNRNISSNENEIIDSNNVSEESKETLPFDERALNANLIENALNLYKTSNGEYKDYITNLSMRKNGDYYNLSAEVNKYIVFSKEQIEEILKDLETSKKEYYELCANCSFLGQNDKTLVMTLEAPNYIKEIQESLKENKFVKPNEMTLENGKTYKFYLTTLDMLNYKLSEEEKNNVQFLSERTLSLELIDEAKQIYSFDSFSSAGKTVPKFEIKKVDSTYSIDLLPDEKIFLNTTTKNLENVLPHNYNKVVTAEEYFLNDGDIELIDDYSGDTLPSQTSKYIERSKKGVVYIKVIYNEESK